MDKPSGLPRPGSSRLPTPKVTVVKRSRMGSTDLEQGLDYKKAKFETPKTTNLNKNKSKSMMVLNKQGVKRNLSGSTTRSIKTDTFTRPPAPTRAGLSDKMNKPSAPPKWDLKGRLEIIEKEFSKSQSRLAQLEQLNVQLETNVIEKENVVSKNTEELVQIKTERDRLSSEIKKAKLLSEEEVEEKDRRMKALKSQIEDLEFKIQGQERKIKSLDNELEAKMGEISGLKSTVASLTSSSSGMEAKLKCVELEYEKAKSEIARLSSLSAEQEDSIKTYEEKSRDYETERRKLHNIIQELKGNIRVFCRLRPLLGEEISQQGGKIRHIDIKADSKSLELLKSPDSPHDTGLKAKNKNYDFEFDKVFGQEATQDAVFDEICQLIQSAIDGYNVCVFAYGQTGSGKTYTMEGGESSNDEGMIPKTIRKIFEETKRLEDKGWTYKLEANFLEIYNEEIRDLLAIEKNLKYEIKMTDAVRKGEIYVSNAKTEVVTSEVQINHLLKLSRKNRAVAATLCNERSSRSHSVFILKITGSNEITSEACQGCLNLVDLAGSERLKESGSEGARLKETLSINKSLSNLSNVIMALAQKDQHVPFRNSKLTHLLQNSLGGNSKTLMFVNVSPREEYFNETLNSLRFATKVNQCQIGTATKRVK